MDACHLFSSALRRFRKPALMVAVKMKNTPTQPYDRIALISTPWPLYSRPSIQLGTLKAYLLKHNPGIEIDIFHFYLSLAEAIGYALYHEISERTWLAEHQKGSHSFSEGIDWKFNPEVGCF